MSADIIPINKSVAVQMLRDDPAIMAVKLHKNSMYGRIRSDVWKDLHHCTLLGVEDADQRQALIAELNDKPHVMSDGRTVWVNSCQGVCIGRFSRFGIDIHSDFNVQLETGKQCLLCTHKLPNIKDWQVFKQAMLHHHKIEIEDKHRPEFLR